MSREEVGSTVRWLSCILLGIGFSCVSAFIQPWAQGGAPLPRPLRPGSIGPGGAWGRMVMMAGSKQAWTTPENEFSRTLSLDDVSYRPVWMRMKATQTECDALAERFEFITLANLAANVSVTRPQSGTILAQGTVEADLDRTCAASGEVFPYHFYTTFKTYIKEIGGEVSLSRYVGGGVGSGGGFDDDEGEDEDGEIDEDMYDDEVEAGGFLDVGEIAAQYLYLNMEPYVTMPGRSLDDIGDEFVLQLDEGDDGRPGGSSPPKKKKPQKPSW